MSHNTCPPFPVSDACIAISGLVERLNTHSGLFESLRKVVDDGDRFPEEDVDKHVAKLFLLGKSSFTAKNSCGSGSDF